MCVRAVGVRHDIVFPRVIGVGVEPAPLRSVGIDGAPPLPEKYAFPIHVAENAKMPGTDIEIPVPEGLNSPYVLVSEGHLRFVAAEGALMSEAGIHAWRGDA